MNQEESPRRRLPAVHLILDHPTLAPAIAERGRPAVRDAVRQTIEWWREQVSLSEHQHGPDPASIAQEALAHLARPRASLRKVINATGVLLNTGLGRAPLAREAIDAMASVAEGYCNLEFDLERGQRGRRTTGVADLLSRLVGSEAAAVVNNNAAATILALRALAHGREVIVSRGQLVEIGGSFRLPEIFEASGARLREVGTTNKTHVSDYERAIHPETAALLRVHASNYKIIGFTASVSIAELVALAKPRGLWTIDDIGSGALDHSATCGIADEPDVRSSLAAGADLVLFSGDKLLGGPQCGLIVGSHAAIQKVENDPLMRAFRVDKLTLAALEATLRLWMSAPGTIPLRRMLNESIDNLRARADQLASQARELGFDAEAVATTATIGGGSVPGSEVASFALRIEGPGSEAQLAQALRVGEPAVVGRVNAGAVLLDLRGVSSSEDMLILESLQKISVGRSL